MITIKNSKELKKYLDKNKDIIERTPIWWILTRKGNKLWQQ